MRQSKITQYLRPPQGIFPRDIWVLIVEYVPSSTVVLLERLLLQYTDKKAIWKKIHERTSPHWWHDTDPPVMAGVAVAMYGALSCSRDFFPPFGLTIQHQIDLRGALLGEGMVSYVYCSSTSENVHELTGCHVSDALVLENHVKVFASELMPAPFPTVSMLTAIDSRCPRSRTGACG